MDKQIYISVADFSSTEPWIKVGQRGEDETGGENVAVLSSVRGIPRKDLFMGVANSNGVIRYFQRIKPYRFLQFGLSEDEEIVPVIYMHMQGMIDRALSPKGDGVERLASYFDWSVRKREKLLKEYSECQVRGITISTVSELAERIRQQLKCGLALFDAEAIMTFVASFWSSQSQGVDWVHEQHALASNALRCIAKGDYTAVRQLFSMMNYSWETSSKFFSWSEWDAYAMALFKDLAITDLMYRRASCETSGARRLERLWETKFVLEEGAAHRAVEYKRRLSDEDSDPILGHIGALTDVVAGGIECTSSDEHYPIVGTFVNGYGPTSARLEHFKVGKSMRLAVIPYAPIKAV